MQGMYIKDGRGADAERRATLASQPQAGSAEENSGMQFLEQLESRHNHVLDELETLNARIEEVLKLYVESRQTRAA